MTKDELFDLVSRARAAQLEAREAWTAIITALGPPESWRTDYRRKQIEANKITENVLNIIRQEIEG